MVQKAIDIDALMTVSQAATRLRVSKRRVRNWMNKGLRVGDCTLRLQFVLIGNEKRTTWDAVMEFIRARSG